MEYYVRKEFKLDKFKAWGGALDTLKTIEEMNIVYQAEDYIEGKLYILDKVTDNDINNLLWFGMDNFIKDTKEQLDEDMLEYFEFTGVMQGVLYAVESHGRLELVTEKMEEETCIICYNNLDDRNNIWTEDNELHVANGYIQQVGVYKVKGDQLFLERTYQL